MSQAFVPPLLHLFVYGTLKRGFSNYPEFCARARDIEPAFVWGRLYHLPAGYPGLVLAEGLILADGTGDPLADARRHQPMEVSSLGRPPGDWDWVSGERMTFTDPLRDLPPIDQLEAFQPDGQGLYQRGLIAVQRRGGAMATAWVYWMKRVEIGTRLPSGVWEEPSFSWPPEGITPD